MLELNSVTNTIYLLYENVKKLIQLTGEATENTQTCYQKVKLNIK